MPWPTVAIVPLGIAAAVLIAFAALRWVEPAWTAGGLVALGAAAILMTLDVPFWRVTGGLAVILYVALLLAYSRGRLAANARKALSREVVLPARSDPEDLYFRPFPSRLSWNLAAFLLGPFWYFIQGLWVHGSILLGLAFVSGGIFIPLVWLYAALKADEDLLEFRLAQKSVY